MLQHEDVPIGLSMPRSVSIVYLQVCAGSWLAIIDVSALPDICLLYLRAPDECVEVSGWFSLPRNTSITKAKASTVPARLRALTRAKAAALAVSTYTNGFPF